MQAQFQYRDEDYNTLFNEFKAIMEKNHELKNDLYACQCTCCRRTTAKKRAHRLEVTKSITSARYSAQGSFVLDGMKKLTKGVRKELHTRLAKLSNRNVDVVRNLNIQGIPDKDIGIMYDPSPSYVGKKKKHWKRVGIWQGPTDMREIKKGRANGRSS